MACSGFAYFTFNCPTTTHSRVGNEPTISRKPARQELLEHVDHTLRVGAHAFPAGPTRARPRQTLLRKFLGASRQAAHAGRSAAEPDPRTHG